MNNTKRPCFITYPDDAKAVRFFRSPLEEVDGEPDGDWICVEDVHALTNLPKEVLDETIKSNAFICPTYPVNLFQQIATENGVFHITPFATAYSLLEHAASCGAVSKGVVEMFNAQFNAYWVIKHSGLNANEFNQLMEKVAARWAAFDFQHDKRIGLIKVN